MCCVAGALDSFSVDLATFCTQYTGKASSSGADYTTCVVGSAAAQSLVGSLRPWFSDKTMATQQSLKQPGANVKRCNCYSILFLYDVSVLQACCCDCRACVPAWFEGCSVIPCRAIQMTSCNRPTSCLTEGLCEATPTLHRFSQLRRPHSVQLHLSSSAGASRLQESQQRHHQYMVGSILNCRQMLTWRN